MANNVAQGRYSFSKEEQNFIYSVISQISQGDKYFKEYEVCISQLEKLGLAKKTF
ncbi:RepB family plasmid replication initiator protein [Francisella sp. TX07-6608]|uniref:RepB family plasmid replication initiator protein n=1 Tax=Francisella sp. TX07-6608 TaxID=573568 RepID=UPI000A07566D|nr:RepB family plasmid replication initiator protein [Francisella sp. TX07-6608]